MLRIPSTAVQGLQVLLTTLVVSLPAIYNVGSLLLLLFFVYAYMGGWTVLGAAGWGLDRTHSAAAVREVLD